MRRNFGRAGRSFEPNASPEAGEVSCAPVGTVMGAIWAAGGIVWDELSAEELLAVLPEALPEPESVVPVAPVGLLWQPSAKSK